MLDSVLNCYNYPNKSFATTIADTLLYPTRTVLGNKTREWAPLKDVEEGHFPLPKTPEKAASCFLRIILAPIAILMLPITFIACIIKLLDGQNQKIGKFHADFVKEIEEDKKNKGKEDDKQIDCNICFESLEKGEKVFLECAHGFHKECIYPWFKNEYKDTCPVCKHQQTPGFLAALV